MSDNCVCEMMSSRCLRPDDVRTRPHRNTIVADRIIFFFCFSSCMLPSCSWDSENVQGTCLIMSSSLYHKTNENLMISNWISLNSEQIWYYFRSHGLRLSKHCNYYLLLLLLLEILFSNYLSAICNNILKCGVSQHMNVGITGLQ